MNYQNSLSSAHTASHVPEPNPPTRRAKLDDWKRLTGRERIVATFDISMQVICSQVARDYATFFRNRVQPAIPTQRRLSPRHYNVLLGLGSVAFPVSGAEIARVQRIDKATISRSLAALRKADLIMEAPDPDDARSRLTTLSKAGVALHAEYLDCWKAAVDEADAAHQDTPRVLMSEAEFLIRLDATYRMRDRARVFATYRPGHPAHYTPGISRTHPAHWHGTARMNRTPDIYMRHFSDFISEDYITCLDARAVSPIVGERDMNITDVSVLMAVLFNDAASTQAQISAILRYDSATVTRSAQTLRDEGLVDLVTLDGDKRTRGLKITADGKRLAYAYLTRTSRLTASIERHFQIEWSRAEKAELLDAFVAMRRRAVMLADFRG